MVVEELKEEIPEDERKRHLKALKTGFYPEEATVKVGKSSRGQYFIRIPKAISERMGLKTTDIMLIKHVAGKKIELEVVKE